MEEIQSIYNNVNYFYRWSNGQYATTIYDISANTYNECKQNCDKLPIRVNRYGYIGTLEDGIEFVVNPMFDHYVVRFWKVNK